MPRLARIVVAVAFGQSDAALQLGSDLARGAAQELHLLHVVADVRERLGAIEKRGQTFYELQQEWVDEAVRRLALLANDAMPCAIVRKVVIDARPADAIARYAADVDADLIVVGTHEHGPVRRWLLGSISDQVRRIARRPVLVVPPRSPRT